MPRFFALLLFACAAALLYTQAVYAIGFSGSYAHAGKITVTSVTFTQADRDNGDIHSDFDDLTIAQINQYVAQQVVGDFIDSDIGNGDRDYFRNNGDCDSKIFVGSSTELQIVNINVPGLGCKDVIAGKDKPLSQAELVNETLPGGGNRAQIWFRWVGENAVVRVDGYGGNFVADDIQTERYVSVEESNHYVGISDSNPSSGSYNEGGNIESVKIGDVQKRSDPPIDPNANPDAGEDEKTCEDTGGDLGWIFCSILEFIDAQLTSLDNQIQSLLRVPPGDFDDASPMKQAWGVMRTIAYSILLPIILVMVISTALGFEFVSAYAIKKALPRFIIATMFIALSWEITTFLITFTNNVGGGVQGLLTTPFNGTDIPTSLAEVLGGGGGATLTLSAVVVAGIAGFAVGPALLGILLSYGFVALIAIFIGFLVLTLRQVLLLTLLLAAPLAILSWIFPGNDKLWKTWWGSFSKLLLMYPLIIALITMGRIFAGVSSSTQSGFLGFFVAIVAYIAPYFFIPATFKLAGGLFATVAGLANDRGRGIFDRQTKKRQESLAQASAKRQTGQLWKGNNAVTNRMNRMGHGAAGGLAGGYGLGRRGRAYKDESTAVASDEMMRSPEWKGAMFKDNAMRALTHTNEASARADLMSRGVQGEELEQALLSAKRVGYGRTSQVTAAKQLAMNKTGFENAADAMSVINRVSGGNGVMADSLRENIKYTSKGVGRNDLGGLMTMKQHMADGGTTENYNDMMTLKGAETADAASLARNHTKSMGNISGASQRVMQSGGAGYETAVKVAGAVGASKDYATLGNVENIDAAARMPTGGTTTKRTGEQTVTGSVSGGSINATVSQAEELKPETPLDIHQNNSPRSGSPGGPDDPRLPGEPAGPSGDEN
ncbi:MFS transporter [Candidatus Saccharibacteria bacterium]|nr:MFS transporter [Candidatus Saccharibacteria bacterium]